MRCIAAAAVACASVAAVAQDLAALPLGDPERAFVLMTGSPGELYDTRTGAAVEFDAMVNDLASADVVILAEHHAAAAVQSMEARIFAALAERGPVVLGMEFFDLEDDPALASYIAGRIQVERLLSQTGWYQQGGYSFKYYEPLLSAARQHKAAVVGLNIPRAWLKTISQDGFTSLTREQQHRIGELPEPTDRHAYMVAHMMGMPGQLHGSTLQVQRAWDGAMAEAIRRAAQKDPGRTVVAVMGVGHAAHGIGVPARLSQIAPDLSVRVVAPVIASEPDPDAHAHPGYEPEATAVFSRGYADYVYTLPDDGGRQQYARLGITLEVTPEGAVGITRVAPGSIAAQAGLQEGDQLLMLGDMGARSIDEVRTYLGELEFNQLLQIVIRRGLVSKPMTIIIVPPTDGPADWLTSEVSSKVLDNFDPHSSRAYAAEGEPRPAGVHARLVYFRDQPERIDVFDRTRLIESWILDEHGRPVLGLFANPTDDGAMRVEIERDETGRVTAERRYDERGQRVENRVVPGRPR